MQFTEFKRSPHSKPPTHLVGFESADYWSGRDAPRQIGLVLHHRTALYERGPRDALYHAATPQHASLDMSVEELDALLAALLTARAQATTHVTLHMVHNAYRHGEALGAQLNALVQQALAQWEPSQTAPPAPKHEAD